MAIDIELACNCIQLVNQNIGGVQTAPPMEKYLNQLNTSSLPYLMTWPSEGSYYIKGGGYKQDMRTFQIVAYVQPLGQNDIPSRLLQVTRLLQAVRSTYITAATVPLNNPTAEFPYQITAESSEGRTITDGGVQGDLSFGGTTYLGFIIRLPIRILWSV